MAKSKKPLIFAGLAIVVVGGIAFGVYNNQKSNPKDTSGAPKGAISAQVQAAATEKITTKVNATGKVELIDKTIVYPLSQAKIKTVHVKVGDVVKAGDLLISFDEETLKTTKNSLDDAKLSLKAAQLGLTSVTIAPSDSELITFESQIKQSEKSVSDATNQVTQSDLNIAQIEDNIRLKQTNYDNIKELYNKGVVSKTDLDNAESVLKGLNDQLDTAKTQRNTVLSTVESAKTALSFAEKQLENTKNKLSEPSSKVRANQQQVTIEQARLRIEQLEKTIADFKLEQTAEVAGTVLTLAANEGDVAAFGKPLMEVADLNYKNFVVRVNVPENKTPGIEVGQDAQITGDSLGKENYPGKVTKIFPQAEIKQIGNTMETVVVVEISPSSENTPIKPGFNVEANVITKVTDNAIVVPLMAITTNEADGTDQVFVMKEDFSVTAKPVKIDSYSGLNVSVTGIEVGEKVLSNPPTTIKEGVFVRPTNDALPVAASGGPIGGM